MQPEELKELEELYQQCFPDKNAEGELSSFKNAFRFDILDSSALIIYNVISPDEVEIFDVGTKPDKRRTGLAQKLIEKTIAKLKEENIRTVYLEVAENNLSAIKLYEKCGFEKYNTRKDYYKSGDIRINAILMKKTTDSTK